MLPNPCLQFAFGVSSCYVGILLDCVSHIITSRVAAWRNIWSGVRSVDVAEIAWQPWLGSSDSVARCSVLLLSIGSSSIHAFNPVIDSLMQNVLSQMLCWRIKGGIILPSEVIPPNTIILTECLIFIILCTHFREIASQRFFLCFYHLFMLEISVRLSFPNIWQSGLRLGAVFLSDNAQPSPLYCVVDRNQKQTIDVKT